ncbi:MAG: ISAs1 family transposase [Nitrososphaera sp.]
MGAMEVRPVGATDRKTSPLPRCFFRDLSERDVGVIRRLIANHPDWNRQQLFLHLCQMWDWRKANGTLNHQSCRALLARLEQLGRIELPCRKTKSGPIRRPEVVVEVPIEIPSVFRLDELAVRPVRLDERERWRQLMHQFHYLGFRRVVGESICYVATIGTLWVALLAWGVAAWKNRHRETWIGWDVALKWRRLHLVANNVRFLILPGIRIKNLASKVLAANARRLSRDWQYRYGHPILLAETFVDVSRFEGTCYRAAGWIPLGQTRGFARTGAGYSSHGKPKMLLVRPLVPDARRMLSASFSPPIPTTRKERIPMIDINRLPIEGEGGLIDLLRTVTDPRKRRGIRHPLVGILAIAICACLSGARSFDAIAQWGSELSREALRRLGCKRRRAPSEKCFRLTLQRLDAAELDRKIADWLARKNNLTVLDGKGLAVDGKTVRGAYDGDRPAPHLLSAILHQEGIVVAQLQVGEKTNEIPCIKPLLNDLNIEGAVVTADALHTQTETARYLVEDKKADYVFTVKDNQPTLRQDIKDLGIEAFPPSAH